MNKKHLYATIIILSFLVIGNHLVRGEYYHIPDDTTIGTWEPFGRIYTLTTDVSGTIQIDEGDMTLDGGLYTVSPTEQEYTDGVYVQNMTGVTIKNLNVKDFVIGTGIHLAGCQNCTLISNTTVNNNIGISLATGTTGLSMNNTLIGNIASNNKYGIKLISSNGDTLTDNTANSNTHYGIELDGSDNYTLTGNSASSNPQAGIRLYGCNNPIGSGTLTKNTTSNNGNGIYLNSSYNNEIYNNNFIGNTSNQAYVFGGGDNVFFQSTGGNYWSNWTGPDDDGDGFVDVPYEFTGGQDDLPWAIENGWLEPEVLIVQLIGTVEDMNLQQGIDNSLDAKLDAAANALDDVNQNNDVAAINSLNAFINAVEAQRNDKITNEQADELIANANYIITLLSG